MRTILSFTLTLIAVLATLVASTAERERSTDNHPSTVMSISVESPSTDILNIDTAANGFKLEAPAFAALKLAEPASVPRFRFDLQSRESNHDFLSNFGNNRESSRGSLLVVADRRIRPGGTSFASRWLS